MNDDLSRGELGQALGQELGQAIDDARGRLPDDVTLRRMWARVADPLPPARRTPRWIWFACGMASTAAVAFAFGGWLSARGGGFLSGAHPPAAAPHVASAPAAAPTPVVGAPGTLRTGAGETVRLTLRGGAEARLGSSSVMSLDDAQRPTVEGGEVGFQVPHQRPGQSFVVKAGPYRVVVVGTKFSLRVDGERQQHVAVSVDEGTVEIWDRARLARLEPGQSWESPAPLETKSETAPETKSETAPETRSETKAAAPAHASHTRRASVVRQLAWNAHGRTEGPAGAAPAVASSAGPSPTASSGAATPAQPAPPMSDGAPPPATSADLAAQARAALAGADVTRALALYRSLAQRGGPAGENAEYEIGRVLRDRLGQPAAALSAWRRYRAEHPAGILRAEADVSIIETLVHGGDSDGALAEANDFLRRYPASERRGEIARVAGDLYRTRGDCGRAVSAYETAIGAPRASGGVIEAATFHRASCLVKLGDQDNQGSDAARAYLRAWPAGRFRDEARLLAGGGAPEARARP